MAPLLLCVSTVSLLLSSFQPLLLLLAAERLKYLSLQQRSRNLVLIWASPKKLKLCNRAKNNLNMRRDVVSLVNLYQLC